MRDLFRLEFDHNRIFGLDLLRALAILFVVGRHGNHFLPGKISVAFEFFVFDGVSIFFVLSGFLIGGILIKIMEQRGFSKTVLFNFWIRRWFRTLPNYFLILIILCALSLVFKDGFTLKSVSSYFIFSQNFFLPHPDNFFPEAWSLSIEEWFYLIIPVFISLLILVTGKKKCSVLVTVLLIILSITFFRYQRFLTIPVETPHDWDVYFRKQVITRMDSLMFGILGAYISFYHNNWWKKNKTILLFTGIFLLCVYKFVFGKYFSITGLYSSVFSFSLISFATSLLLPYLSEMRTGNNRFSNAITYISLISYSMYLLNLSIIQFWIMNQIPWNSIFTNYYLSAFSKYFVYWMLLIVFSFMLYKYFESPMTRLRDHPKIKFLLQTRSGT